MRSCYTETIMENQEHPQAPLQQTNHSTTQAPKKSALDMKIIFAIIFAFVFMGAVATASYVVGRNEGAEKLIDAQSQLKRSEEKVTSLEQSQKRLQTELDAQSATKNTQQGTSTTNGNQAAITPTLDKLRSYLAGYKKQYGQYPSSVTPSMKTLMATSDYSLLATSALPVCARDPQSIAYKATLNATTYQNDSFNLYYCEGTTLQGYAGQ